MDPDLTSRKPRRGAAARLAGFCVIALAAAGGIAYIRLIAEPPFEDLRPRRPQARAAIKLSPQLAQPGGEQPAPAANPPNQESLYELQRPLDALEAFRGQTDEALLQELRGAFTELPSVLDRQTVKSNDSAYRTAVFHLLDAAKEAAPERRLALWLAADLVAKEIWCDNREREACQQLREDFARHELSLKGDALGGVWVYGRDLLWRLWGDYGKTHWGEAAFVLLLDRGWDTSPTCEHGGDQFREVIRQGESFLEERPASPYRPEVLYLVAEAYEAWWSLSRAKEGDEYVDPARYQQGADAAREKSISYYEQVIQAAPKTKVAEIARQAAPLLRDRQDTNERKFFCVYD